MDGMEVLGTAPQVLLKFAINWDGFEEGSACPESSHSTISKYC